MMYVNELFMHVPCRDSYYCEDGVYINVGCCVGDFKGKTVHTSLM